MFQEAPQEEIIGREDQNEDQSEKAAEELALHTLRTLTEGGYEDFQIAKGHLEAYLKGREATEVGAALQEAIGVLPENGRGVDISEGAKETLRKAWSAVLAEKDAVTEKGDK